MGILDLVGKIFSGKQYCPFCHCELEHDEDEELWTCPQCKFEITDEEVDEGYGYDSLEESYGDNYDDDDDDDIPECCIACGGPYPNCTISCKIFDD